MLLLPLLCAAARAAEFTPALALPSAVALGAGQGQAAAGAALATGDPPLLSGTLRANIGLTSRLALSGGLRAPWGGLLLGLRYNVVERPEVRVAPFVFGAASESLVTGTSRSGDSLAAGLGVALEGGWPKARLDASVPLVVTTVNPLVAPLYAPLALGSYGLTIHLTRRHDVRLALESFAAPSVTVRYARDRWYVQGAAMYAILHATPLAALEAGLRF